MTLAYLLRCPHKAHNHMVILQGHCQVIPAWLDIIMIDLSTECSIGKSQLHGMRQIPGNNDGRLSYKFTTNTISWSYL